MSCFSANFLHVLDWIKNDNQSKLNKSTKYLLIFCFKFSVFLPDFPGVTLLKASLHEALANFQINCFILFQEYWKRDNCVTKQAKVVLLISVDLKLKAENLRLPRLRRHRAAPQSQARCIWAGFVFLLRHSTHFFFYLNLFPPFSTL